MNWRDLMAERLPESTLDLYWRAAFTAAEHRRVQYRVKRMFDVVAAAVLLVILSPLLLAIAIGIKLTSRGPVLYRQLRLGQDWREFTLLKFRTMVDGAESMTDRMGALNEASGPLFKASADPRITSFGRLLRRTFLDELPQLVNVFRGDLSLVGPRPCLPREANQVEEELYFRFAVPQGMTGPWQTNGYHSLSFREQFKLECEYVQNWSMLTDLWILMRTVPMITGLKGR